MEPETVSVEKDLEILDYSSDFIPCPVECLIDLTIPISKIKESTLYVYCLALQT